MDKNKRELFIENSDSGVITAVVCGLKIVIKLAETKHKCAAVNNNSIPEAELNDDDDDTD